MILIEKMNEPSKQNTPIAKQTNGKSQWGQNK